jgi:glycosyltransferase involved in cell wall biosynthesis
VIKQQVYIFDRSLKGTSRQITPDRIETASSTTTGPLVSCLMVTRGDLPRVRASIGYFKKQTYRSKELVIVCDAISVGLTRLVAESGADVRLVQADERLSLGLLRNVSVEQAHGDIVCQWDDDDLYGAHRIERSVGALMQTKADAVFLRQWCIWSPGQRILRLSGTRVWEGSMVALKAALPRYPDARHAEDTAMVEIMFGRSLIALMDDPLSYCYCIHGQNTYDEPHFRIMLGDARLKLSYGKALAALSTFFAFDEHPAATQPDRTMLAENAGDTGQLRRLRRYVAINQFLRRLRYRLKRRAA